MAVKKIGENMKSVIARPDPKNPICKNIGVFDFIFRLEDNRFFMQQKLEPNKNWQKLVSA